MSGRSSLTLQIHTEEAYSEFEILRLKKANVSHTTVAFFDSFFFKF